MSNTNVYLYTDPTCDGHDENWTLLAHLVFMPMSSQWVLDGKIPEEKDIIPWQEVVLPSGEHLFLGVVFDDPEKSLSLHVKAADRCILELITKGRPNLRFFSPGGCGITLQIHE